MSVTLSGHSFNLKTARRPGQLPTSLWNWPLVETCKTIWSMTVLSKKLVSKDLLCNYLMLSITLAKRDCRIRIWSLRTYLLTKTTTWKWQTLALQLKSKAIMGRVCKPNTWEHLATWRQKYTWKCLTRIRLLISSHWVWFCSAFKQAADHSVWRRLMTHTTVWLPRICPRSFGKRTTARKRMGHSMRASKSCLPICSAGSHSSDHLWLISWALTGSDRARRLPALINFDKNSPRDTKRCNSEPRNRHKLDSVWISIRNERHFLHKVKDKTLMK